MKKKKIILLVLCQMLLFLTAEMSGQSANRKNATMGPAFFLEQLGYKSDTKEDLLYLTRSDSSFVRSQALELLAERYPEESAGIIKEFVTDTSLEVRWRAARCLNNLGDSVGLKQMQKDYHILTAPHMNEEQFTEDPNEIDAASERQKNADFYQAVNAALVLAEMGDFQGYDLIETMAINGPSNAQRRRAIMHLIDVAKLDASVLVKHQVDPIGVLCVVGKHEIDRINVSILVNLSQSSFTPETANLILSFVLENKNQSESLKQTLRQASDRLKKTQGEEN